MIVVGETVITAPICPSDHLTVPVQPAASICVLEPPQICVLLQFTTGGIGFPTLIVAAADGADSHEPTLQIAVYIVVTVGCTLIDADVSPLDQSTVPLQPNALSVKVSPSHILDAEHEITGESGFPVTFIVTLFDWSLVHPP